MNNVGSVARSTVEGEGPSFAQRLNGRFNGLVRLADAWHLAATIVDHDGWYLVDPARPEEVRQVTGPDAGCHLEGLLEEILREEKGVWSTLVYVQDIANPEIIKIFHPRRAGCGCGGGGGILPWWVMTRVEPEPVSAWQAAGCAVAQPASEGGKGLSWIKSLF